MVLSSKCRALTTQRDLDEENDAIEEAAIEVRVESRPFDPDTEPELLHESRIARG